MRQVSQRHKSLKRRDSVAAAIEVLEAGKTELDVAQIRDHVEGQEQ
jgi:hypothetical protein